MYFAKYKNINLKKKDQSMKQVYKKWNFIVFIDIKE